jgi:predicted DNA-binding protein YlxM (UPF0122 family)
MNMKTMNVSNKSIAQLNQEVLTAKKQALRDPYQFERSDDGLSDMMTQRLNISGSRNFPADVRQKIDNIFDKFPDQLKILGLYYDAGFTIDEIAEMQNSQRDSVARSLSRAKSRLRKTLTAVEYDSIRWAIGDPKALEATQPRFVNPFYNDFVEPQPVAVYQWDGQLAQKVDLENHPAPKVLPKGSFYYEVKSIETGISGCTH